MNWKAAIDKFEERRLAIWENMPQDVYDLSGGKVPGDTNVYGQYVTTMMYADSELRTLCDEVLFYMIETAKEGDVDLRTLIHFALSCSNFIRAPRPYPRRRRANAPTISSVNASGSVSKLK